MKTEEERTESVNCAGGASEQDAQPLSWSNLRIAKAEQFDATAAHLINHLRITLQWGQIEDLLKGMIIDHEFVRHGIDAHDDEISTALTEFRIRKHLLTSAATQKWLEEQHLSYSDLHTMIERQVKLRKLKSRLFDDEAVNEQFALIKASLTEFGCFQIVVRQERKAAEIAALLQTGASFFDLARRYSEDQSTRRACGFLGMKHFSDFDPDLQVAIAAAVEGDIVGPIKNLGQYHFLLVDSVSPAVLDHQTRENIRTQLFQKWSEDRVKVTPIQMCI